MAYQEPAFSFLHVARDAGVANLTSTTAYQSTNPIDFLVDDLGGPLARTSAAATFHDVIIDRGAAGLESPDRLLVPAGHNLDSRAITIFEDDNSGFTSATPLVVSAAVSGSGLIDVAFTASTERYMLVRIDVGASAQYEVGELFITRKQQLGRGPDPNWPHPRLPNVLPRTNDAGVESFKVLGADRKTYDLTFRGTSGADLAILENLETSVGTHTPFYFDPPDDTFPTVLVRAAAIEPQQDYAVPAVGHTHRYRLLLVEALG